MRCSGSFPHKATVAPLSQPNYTFLRLDSALIQPDVIPLHDLHNASPAGINPRVTNLATGAPRVERQGVYLHWMLPKFYRSGKSQDTSTDTQDLRLPQFRAAPDRWLVIRRLHPSSFQPADVVQKGLMKELTAWVVESNRLRNIQEFDRDVDIELECAPYITGGDDTQSLDGQAEIFVGRKLPLEQWREELQTKPSDFVRLDVAGAANPLFADYAPHNPNVFSMLDNFSWTNPDKSQGFLTQATASYHVLGWHASSVDDPLSTPGGKSLTTILNDLSVVLNQPSDKDKVINLNTWPSARVMCHGTMYTVKYPVADSADISVPADEAAEKFTNPKSHPVTVGATPLDSVLAYVRAHQSELDAAGVPSDSTLRATEADILHLETLLLKQDDDAESQQEALDMLSANNFKPAQNSGSHWSFSAASPTNGQTTMTTRTTNVFVPSQDETTNIESLNAAQMAYDAASRELQSERWSLFARWWQYVADAAEINAAISTFAAGTVDQSKLVIKLGRRTDRMKAVRDSILDAHFPKDTNSQRVVVMGSQNRFYTQKDPTILVPGVPNSWPNDWMLPLKVRLSTQILKSGGASPPALPGAWAALFDIASRLPQEQKSTATILVSEFFNLHPKDTMEDSWSESPSVVNPLYHDHVLPSQQIAAGVDVQGHGRDQWGNTQAWFPLFMEWEARYYHIPWDHWRFQDNVPVDPLPGNPLRTRYGIDPDQTIQGLTGDERIITGRVLILPQPGYSLSINIQALFLATQSSDLPDELRRPEQQAEFLTNVQQLQYLSAPMAGFLDHLVTKTSGTHVRPSVRLPGMPVVPLKAAITSTKGAMFDDATIRLMDIETAKTPYANFVKIDKTIAPMKPVTHGQFKFTRLDIFDKFGQAISAINPAPANQIPPLLPALSEYFHPQHLKGDTRQAVTVGQNLYGTCQYAQFPPAINQDARINASYLSFDDSLKLWRPCTEWENPVWGYLVVNYAEYALQVFLPTGEFYREARFGGPTGTTETAWQPFEPPKDRALRKDHPQLDNLLTELKDPAYLRSFVQMINQSLSSVAHTPDTYADFLNAIVGRPLALVNMGFSIELAAPPVKNQSTMSQKEEPLGVTDYPFAVKVGDRDRVYDGLVGYFKLADNPKSFGSELDLKVIHTYYPAGTSPTAPISPDTYPTAKPYYDSLALDNFQVETASDQTALDLALQKCHQHYNHLQMLGTIIDPFSDLHLYSGVLPIASLKLPSWTLQNAMQRMTAFFHMGPLLITTPDLQKQYDATKKLADDYDLTAPLATAITPPSTTAASTKPSADPNAPLVFKGVPIPSMDSADWNWLQPFYRRPTDSQSNAGATTTTAATVGSPTPETPSQPTKELHWNPFEIARMDNKPKFENGPYTAVEGFLQLKRPILAPEVNFGTK